MDTYAMMKHAEAYNARFSKTDLNDPKQAAEFENYQDREEIGQCYRDGMTADETVNAVAWKPEQAEIDRIKAIYNEFAE